MLVGSVPHSTYIRHHHHYYHHRIATQCFSLSLSLSFSPFCSPAFCRSRYIFVWFLFRIFFFSLCLLDRINSRYGISFARFIPLTKRDSGGGTYRCYMMVRIPCACCCHPQMQKLKFTIILLSVSHISVHISVLVFLFFSSLVSAASIRSGRSMVITVNISD